MGEIILDILNTMQLKVMELWNFQMARFIEAVFTMG